VTADDAVDRHLLARLRAMWERRDPPPPGLVDSVLLALATHDLAAEYELLVLVESTERLAGTRGSSETRTLTFAGAGVTVVLRVSATGEGRRRVDGWLAPAAVREVRLRSGDGEWRTTSTEHGRFELADVPAGEALVHLEPASSEAGAAGAARGLTTPPFPL
jgi:hypothetical protein